MAAQMAAAYEAAGRGDYASCARIWTPLAHAGVAARAEQYRRLLRRRPGRRARRRARREVAHARGQAGDPVGQRNLAAALFQGRGRRAGLCARRRALSRRRRTGRCAGAGHAELDAARRRGDRARLRRGAPPRRTRRRAGHRRLDDAARHDLSQRARRRTRRARGRRLVAQGRRCWAMPTARRCLARPIISARASRAIRLAAFGWLLRARDGGSPLAGPVLRRGARDAVAGRDGGGREARRRAAAEPAA